MTHDKWRTLRVALTGVVVMALCAGCIGLHREVSTDTHGTRVTTAKLGQVSEGTTTRDDIVKAFGTPTQSFKLKGNREILIYAEERSERSETAFMVILPLFSWESDLNDNVVRYVFEFEDDVLVDYHHEDAD